jgi:hypothetical protein
VGLQGASHEASGQKIKPEMPKLFLHGPLAYEHYQRPPQFSNYSGRFNLNAK